MYKYIHYLGTRTLRYGLSVSAICGILPLRIAGAVIVFIFFSYKLNAQTTTHFHVQFNDIKKFSIASTKTKDEKELYNQAQKNLFLFYQKGYLLPTLDSVVQDSSINHVYYSSGKIFKYARLGSYNIEDKILNQIGFREKLFFNEPISYKNYFRVHKKLLSYYENHGYPFASIFVDSISIVDQKLSGLVTVNKGIYFSYDTLILTSDAKIATRYLQAYLGVKKNTPYSENTLRKIKTRINTLPFANMKSEPIVEFADNKVNVKLDIQKRNANQFYGIVGFAPRNDLKGEFLITADVKLRLQNLLRRGELFHLQWQRLQNATQRLQVNAMYPYFLNTPLGLEGKFDFYRIDTSFYTIQIHASALYMIKGNDYIKLFYQYALNRKILNEQGISTISAINNFDLNYYGIGIQLERTDDRWYPRKGYNLYSNIAFGTKSFLSSPPSDTVNIADTANASNQWQVNINGSIEGFIPFAKRFVFKIGARGAVLYNPNLYLSELYRIGGLNTLRGFDEESIFSNVYGIGTTEIRFLLDDRSYVNLFCDAGYYQRTTRNEFYDSHVVGFGAGITFDTKFGAFTLNYALGTQKNAPIDFRRSKIHFGYINYF